MKEEKHCCNCRYFRRYYVKGLTKFKAVNCGRCGKFGDYVMIHDECESFVRKNKR